MPKPVFEPTFLPFQAGWPMFVSLLFCFLATSNIVSGWVPICDSVRSWCLENQAISPMTWYPNQSHYPDTEPTTPFPILIMPSTWLGSNTYHWFDSTMGSNPRSPVHETRALHIQPPCPVGDLCIMLYMLCKANYLCLPVYLTLQLRRGVKLTLVG